jgi:tRNA (cytidine/uridine-2'-O-)-methyltransferase
MPARVVLYKPQIPPNTGNIARQCVGWNTPLTILGRPGFSLDDSNTKRAGLDHWAHLDYEWIQKFGDFYKLYSGESTWIAVTKEGDASLWNTELPENPIFLFGSETNGLPPALRKQCVQQLRIPVYGPVRSFNLANSVAVVLSEYLRQYPIAGEIRPLVKTYRKSANAPKS